MKAEWMAWAALGLLVVAGCDLGDTDIGNVPEAGGSGESGEVDSVGDDMPSGGQSSGEEPTEPCAEAGEVGVLLACCEGLDATPAGLCYESQCPGGVCPAEVGGCATQHSDTAGADPEGIIRFRDPEVCLPSEGLSFASVDGEQGLHCYVHCDSDSEFFGPTFLYESPDLELQLRLGFAPEARAGFLAGYTTEQFNEHLSSVTGSADVPGTQQHVQIEEEQLSDFVYEDGRLKFTATVELGDASSEVGISPECDFPSPGHGCDCQYEGGGTHVISFDLEIEPIDA